MTKAHDEITTETMLNMTYEERVYQLEQQGLTTSDAQAVADLEEMRGQINNPDRNAKN